MTADSSHRLTIGEILKKSSSLKSQGPKIIYLVCSTFINSANCGPGVQIYHTLGASISAIGLEKEKQIFFSETTRARACIFSM